MESAGASYNFAIPHDDYALAILTHAAQHTGSSAVAPPAIDPTSGARTGGRQPSALHPPISKQSSTACQPHVSQAQAGNTQPPNVTQTASSDIPSSWRDRPAILGSRRAGQMETLSYNHGHGARQQYMNTGYRGLGPYPSSNDLGILSAASYDDGRLATSTREARATRPGQQQAGSVLSFGIVDESSLGLDGAMRSGSEERDTGKGKDDGSGRKHGRVEVTDVDEEDEEARKKVRGRPRVDTKDETAADRRRTQIRMAQRAYRHRKETTITALEKQVQELRGTNEEMSKIFISLYDLAVGKGLLQREPEFSQQLQATTERLLSLAKTSTNEEGVRDENTEDARAQDEPVSGRGKKGSKASSKKRQETVPPPTTEAPVQPWGGYTLDQSDNPVEEALIDFRQDNFDQGRQIITRPTEANASFPFDLMESMDHQQYRVEVPQIQDFSQNFIPQSQLPLPNTHSYTEFSFARRLQRSVMEKAWQLVSMEDPPMSLFQRVFGLALMYETREQIKDRLMRCLESSVNETLQYWRAPLVHVGGAGTYYPQHVSEVSCELMPKLRTGYSMGPFSPPATKLAEYMQDDMRLKLPCWEGDFFDSNDVEGFLRGKGLDIPPAADYVTVELDLSLLTEVSSPGNSSSTVTTVSPKTPDNSVERLLVNRDYSYNQNFGKPEGEAFPFPQGFANLKDMEAARVGTNINPHLYSGTRQLPAVAVGEDSCSEKRLVTISVQTLLDNILSHGVCLGRAPGFRPSDVNAAFVAAVRAGL